MRTTKMIWIMLLAAVMLPATVLAENYTVSLGEVAKCLKTAKPGDCIQIADGTYSDVTLKWKAQGTAEKPVIIEALHAGKVIINGKSSLQIGGEYLTVKGLYFRDGEPARKTVVDFALNGVVANHCRLTDCVIDNFNDPQRDVLVSYITLSGRHNRVDHCSLLRKENIGVTLLVNLNGDDCLQNYHQVDHNYFGRRAVYGSNGAETMRIGTSNQSYFSSNTIIEDNLFEQCSGEVEVISVKSCDNIVRRNILLECEGVVALRHGKRNLVEHNWFVGNGKRNTGGVRVVDADHRVVNNVFYGLAGERFFSALGVMDGVPNSLPNRYVRVSNLTVSGNTFVNCKALEMGTGMDPERTEAPVGVTFADNKIVDTAQKEPLLMTDKSTQMTCSGNLVQLAKPYNVEGFTSKTIKLPKLPTYKEMREGKGATWMLTTKDDGSSKCKADTINFEGREYRLTETILIERPTVICGVKGRTVLRYVGDQPASMITIANGGSLKVNGIIFDGRLEAGKRLAFSGISTAEKMNRTYRLKVDDCEFRNFVESTFAAIKGAKATFADSVVISNSRFYDISGNGIDYSAERDDKGRYDVDDFIVENCTFQRFLGIPVNVYRGGSDESTAGPYVSIKGCVFDDCCNRQRGSVMRLIGPQLMTISDCSFKNSGLGGASIRLDEAIWEKICIRDCVFENSGRVMTSTDKVEQYNNVVR